MSKKYPERAIRLTEEEKKAFFDDKTIKVYNRALECKEKLINDLRDNYYLKLKCPSLGTPSGNFEASKFLDQRFANSLNYDYVDMIGFDLLTKDEEKIRVSSKSEKDLFLVSGGTDFITDSNKRDGGGKYDNAKHEENTKSDVYILAKTTPPFQLAIAPKAVCKILPKNGGGEVKFAVPNDSYIKYVISKEDNITYDENYVCEDKKIINYIKARNDLFGENKENNDTEKSV